MCMYYVWFVILESLPKWRIIPISDRNWIVVNKFGDISYGLVATAGKATGKKVKQFDRRDARETNGSR